MRKWAICVIVFLLSVHALGDVVTTTSGNKIECIVLQESTNSVVIRIGYGTMTYPRFAIASITKSPVLTETSLPTTRVASDQRIPSWNSVLAILVKSKWATDVQQIPATVIDVGVMRHVPYQSYRCGTDYEINIYGDPDHPAGVEIGIYRTLLNSAEAKRNCAEFIASILPDKTDAAIARALDRSKDLVTRDDMTTEITPSTSPDAYGGWWVSVYSEKLLDQARATEEELKQITVAKATPAPRPIATVTPAPRPAVQPQVIVSSVNDDEAAWTPRDMSYSRPSSGGTGGTVYVRGYYRKNGTYVQPYTRRAPRR